MFKIFSNKNQKTSISNSNKIEMKKNNIQYQAEQVLFPVLKLPEGQKKFNQAIIIPNKINQEQMNRNYGIKKKINQQIQQLSKNLLNFNDISEYVFDQLNFDIKTQQIQDSCETQKIRSSSIPIEKIMCFSKSQLSKSLHMTQYLSPTPNNNSLQHRQNFLNKLQPNSYAARIFIQQQNQQLLKQSSQLITRRLKYIFLSVFFIMVILIRLKLKTKKRFIQLKSIQAVLKNCKMQIAKYDSQDIIYQRQNFVKFLANKITQFMQTSDYYEKCEMELCLIKADFRKTNLFNLSKLFYQNLELLTRSNNFPQLFRSEMIMSLFYKSKRKSSVFVGLRCYFYKKNITFIPKEQKLAISLEYLFFELIIPNLFKIAEDLDEVSIKVKEEITSNLFGIASYIHKQFLQKFKNLKKLEQPNANMIFKRFNLLILNDDRVQFEIIENKEIGNEELIVDGLIDVNTFVKLEAEKSFWKSQMEQLFDRICQNVEKLIDF